MCGLAGLLLARPDQPHEALLARARAMAQGLAARGPDQEGTWADAHAGVALAFRRLAVLDLSSAGSQPMHSASRRYVLVFNGEIYDAEARRAELEAQGRAPAWRGHADTEVLLAAIEAWGLETTLERCDGMFALALWDTLERTLTLARDRLGEKPLYYGWCAGAFVFGSQIAPLRGLPGFDTRLSRAALASLLLRGWVAAPQAIYACLKKLPAGSLLRVSASTGADARPQAWWSLAEEVGRASAVRSRWTDEAATDALGEALRASVRARVHADVPVGLLLSGGVDSSSVAACLPEGADVRIFTAGFEEQAQDESGQAVEVARQLGLEASVLRVAAADALALVPRLPTLWDEPFADSSQIPTALICALARREVTVVLTGDGGDELFGGYAWHRAARSLLWWWRQRWADARNPLAGSASAAERVQRNVHAVWRERVLAWDPLQGGPALEPGLRLPDGLSRGRRLQALDAATYLPDDLLVKVDRAAMGVGLEPRAPFLARDLVRLAWSLPDRQLVRGGRGKHVLRTFLRKRLPERLVERPKQGFSIPLDAWLRGPLAGWAGALLEPSRLRAQGVLAPEVVGRAWDAHRAGRAGLGRRLWSVLMLQAWLDAPSGPGARPEVAP